MPEIDVRNISHREAVQFFQNKLLIPTRRWEDMIGPIHAKGFTVAGATKLRLLQDFYNAIEASIIDGSTITEFRKNFDNILAKHGWSYKGKRGWRTSVIYRQNKQSAYMAGRWQQIWRVRDERPFLQYLTMDDGRERPSHRKWHFAIFPVTDPIWKRLYPPNDYLCRCIVRALSRDDMEAEGLRVSSKAAPEQKLITDPDTGEQFYVTEGIGRGFDYNVGQNWLAPEALLGQQLMELPSDLRSNAIRWFDSSKYSANFSKLVNKVSYAMLTNRTFSDGSQTTAGFLSSNIIDHFFSKGVVPFNALITVKDSDIAHWLRDSKRLRGAAIPITIAQSVPDIIQNPDVVLFDKEDKALIYAKRLADGRYAKFVVRLNFKAKLNANGMRFKEVLNQLKTAGIVLSSNLKSQRYEVIQGQIIDL